MKTVAAVFAVLFAAQVAADCSDIEFEPAIPGGVEAARGEMPVTGQESVDDVERREAYLDCLKPDPFVPERIDLDLGDIADDFSRDSERFVDRGKAVAVN